MARFESEFALYCGEKYALGVGNGMDALRLIFEGYKIMGKLKTGDKVLVCAHNYIATVLAIRQAGLIPVFVEAEETLFNMNVDSISESVLTDIKAILVTHIYGQIGPIEKIKRIAKSRNIPIIEDAAQAHGADYKGKNGQPGRCGGL